MMGVGVVVSVVVGSIDHVGLVGLWALVGVVLARHGSCGRAGVLRCVVGVRAVSVRIKLEIERFRIKIQVGPS